MISIKHLSQFEKCFFLNCLKMNQSFKLVKTFMKLELQKVVYIRHKTFAFAVSFITYAQQNIAEVSILNYMYARFPK